MPAVGRTQEAPAPKPDPVSEVSEVIVTATRRETRLLDAPVSVSSFSGEKLKQGAITNLSDLASSIPGLNLGQSNADARVTIRGIGNNNVTGGADPGVAYHQDGVYVGLSGAAMSTFFDVQRVEVLRGPQGTLFGQNATGGAVNVIPALPTRSFAAELGATVGVDPFSFRTEGFVSGPLNADGSLQGRLSGVQVYDKGYVKNLAKIGPDRFNNQEGGALRAQLAFEPSADFSGRLSLTAANQTSNGPGYQLVGPATTSGLGLTPEELAGGSRPRPNSFDVYANDGLNNVQYEQAALHLQANIGPGTLTTVVAYTDIRNKLVINSDATRAALVNSIATLKDSEVFAEAIYDLKVSGSVDVIAGVNAYYDELDSRLQVPIKSVPQLPFFFANFGPGRLLIAQSGTPVVTRTWAGFVHADYHVTSRAELFAGVRYTHDSKSIDNSNTITLLDLTPRPTIVLGADKNLDSWDRVTYEFGGSFKVNPSLNLYAKNSTGFKGGGYQVGVTGVPAVRPETNNSIEVGLKGVFADGALRVNLAAYRMAYSDLQVTQVLSLSQSFTNAAKAQIDGLEAEVDWKPTPALEIGFNGALMHGVFDDFMTSNSADTKIGAVLGAVDRFGVPSFGQILDCAGDVLNPARSSSRICPANVQLHGKQLPNAPRATFNLSAGYTIASRLGDVRLGGRYYWQSRVYFNEFNLAHLSQRPVGRLDLSAELTSRDRAWRGGLFVKNATNEVVRNAMTINAYSLGSAAAATLDPGRQVGVSLRREF